MAQQLSLGDAFETAPRHRLFFGIWPDASAADRLTALMAQLRGDKIMPGRPVDTDRLHLTLQHLGDFADQIPQSLLPSAIRAAETVKARPFEIVFDRVGGTRGQFLLRTSDGAQALTAFRQSLSVALIKAGLGKQLDRSFMPHVTLSYDFCDVPEREIAPVGWTVREFVLVESLLGKHRHIRRGHWPVDA